jgi:hypothetical protein
MHPCIKMKSVPVHEEGTNGTTTKNNKSYNLSYRKFDNQSFKFFSFLYQKNQTINLLKLHYPLKKDASMHQIDIRSTRGGVQLA